MATENDSHTRTAEEVRAWFGAYGVSVSEWAKSRGFAREVVYAVLSGRTRGCRGQAYQVAVALGLRSPPPLDGQSPLDAVIAPANRFGNPTTSSENEVVPGKDIAMSP